MIPLLPQIHPPMYQERSPMRNETKRSVSTKLSAAYEFGTNFERERKTITMTKQRTKTMSHTRPSLVPSPPLPLK